MNQKILHDCPPVIRDFLFYMETIKGKSDKTVSEYYLDLRTFFRFIKLKRGIVGSVTDFEDIKIADVDINLIKTVTLSDAYEFMNYINTERHNNAKTRSRKTSSLRSFFKYLTAKAGLLSENPIRELELPSQRKSIPKHLDVEESINLLSSINEHGGSNQARDFCIITLFLNCGMRLSELVHINISDIKDNSIKIVGKGNKERLVYLNEASLAALNDYIVIRNKIKAKPGHENALFLSRLNRRISVKTVQLMVSQYLQMSGLGNMGYSVHKLRHTAATLMYQYGNVDIRVLKELLGHSSLATTEIYTHVSNAQVQTAVENNPLAKVKISSKKSK